MNFYGAFLLALSLGLYALAGWQLPLLLLGLGALVWAIGRKLALAQGRARLGWLWAGLGSCLGLMLAAKSQGLWLSGHAFSTLGVSYWLFQAAAYLLEIYFGQLAPLRSPWSFWLYLAFFPRLIQGPVEKPQDFLAQLPARPSAAGISPGLWLLGWGLFEKMALAERAAPLAQSLLGNLGAAQGPALYLGMWLYALRLFFDFAGYSHMALGGALILGLRLTPNFNAPFAAANTADLWRRWHISFSNWIRDYLFQPLQMAFRGLGPWGNYLALLGVFSLVGLWHKANAGLLTWGFLQGLFISVGIAMKPWQKKAYRALGLEGSRLQKAWRVALTANMTCFAILFTHALNWGDVAGIIQRFGQGWAAWGEAWARVAGPDLGFLAGGMALSLGLLLWRQLRGFDAAPAWLRWGAAHGLLALLIFGGRYFGARQFIYAQF